MKRSSLAVCGAMLAIAGSALAAGPNHTVAISVPVDISAMPYVKTFTVGCRLTYPAGTALTPDISAAAYNRLDTPLAGGEFHGKVTIAITAADGPTPTGYHCELSLTPADGSGGFTPVPAGQSGVLAEHQAAGGTTPVTAVNGVLTAPPAPAPPTKGRRGR